MKNIYLKLALVFILLNAFIVKGQTTVPAGLVSGNWNLAGSPYNVTGSIQVANSTTLTIDPGVTINFQGHYKFLVQGTLLALGNITDTIRFTASNTTTGWFGLRFDNTPLTNDTSRIYYCKIQHGIASGAFPDYCGGAVFVKNYSKLQITNCLISNNTALRGGGIYCYYSNAIISKNTIRNNSVTSGGGGGGIACDNASPSIIENKINNNQSSGGGGGIWAYTSSAPVIRNNIISYNSASQSGGGINCQSASPAIINNNFVCNNTASGIGVGGGIMLDNSSANLFNNSISNNKASNSNYAGGGVAVYNCSPIINNCTITNNAATSATGGGGGLIFVNSLAIPAAQVNLTNVILWGNTSASGSGANVFLYDETSDPNFYYCDIEGGSAAFGVNGNFYMGAYSNCINSNPNFISPSGGSGNTFNGLTANWSLQNGSPCIDTGDPTTTSPLTDIAGNPRVTVCRIDMGAYEYQNGTPFLVSIIQSKQILCNGTSTGELVASVSGGLQPYTYLWSGGSTNDTLSNLPIGTYTVNVGSASGCSRTVTFTISQPAGMTLSSSQTNIDCSGNCIGSATVTPSGGTAPYTYLWSSAPTATLAATPANLCSGVYTATVTDNVGCIKTKTVNITTPASLTFSTTNANVSCNGGNNGSITVNATGGVPALQYSKNGGISYQSSANFTGLVAGTYSIVVQDNNGCQTSISLVTITEPPLLTTSTSQNNVFCFGASNGSASVTVNGGTPAYSYTWNTTPNQNTAVASNLIVGNYTVTVKDQNNCTTTASVSIISTLPQPLICMATVDSVSQYNVIYWDNSGFSAVDSFFVYRDTANNNYALIGKQPFTSNQFTDTTRALYAANGDPNASSWRYKIAVKDVCGSFSPKSPFHQTIFFQNNTGNFNWSPYQIEGQPLPIPALSNYLFKRDNLSTNNWNTIQTLSASSVLYTDVNYALYQSTGNWRVETQWSISCAGIDMKVMAVSKSRSNIKNNNLVIITSIHSLATNNFIMMPNPANDFVEIEFVKNTTNMLIEIIDVVGRVVISEKVNTNDTKISIKTSHLTSGIYTVKMTCNEGKAVKKLVIER